MARFTLFCLRGVRSKEGYEVRFKNDYELEYREKTGRCVTLYSAPMISPKDEPFSVIHLRHALAWESHGILLTDRDRQLLKRRIRAALKFMSEPHEFR